MNITIKRSPDALYVNHFKVAGRHGGAVSEEWRVSPEKMRQAVSISGASHLIDVENIADLIAAANEMSGKARAEVVQRIGEWVVERCK